MPGQKNPIKPLQSQPWPQASGLCACSGGWKQTPSLERYLFHWTFLICFPRVFLHEMEILTLSEALPNWESPFSVTWSWVLKSIGSCTLGCINLLPQERTQLSVSAWIPNTALDMVRVLIKYKSLHISDVIRRAVPEHVHLHCPEKKIPWKCKTNEPDKLILF